MTSLRHVLLAAAAAASAGCSTVNPPLLFGDHTTYGLHIGNDSASAGAAVALGYKARSLAVVPLSFVNGDGRAGAVRGSDDGDKDALSVFAVFENSARPSDVAADAAAGDSSVALGQMFSTGLAAQWLTRGYQCRHRADAAGCAAQTAAAPAKTAGAAAPAKPAPPLSQAVAETAPERPYQAPLVFMKSDVVGIDISGSIAEKGAQFTLGYTGRNIALIPVVAESRGHAFTTLLSTNADGRNADAYSVLGQFKANSATAKLRLGLDRYFATGVAAQNLADGLQAAIAGVQPVPATTAARSASASPRQP